MSVTPRARRTGGSETIEALRDLARPDGQWQQQFGPFLPGSYETSRNGGGTVVVGHTWAITNEIKVASGVRNFLIPMPVKIPDGQAAEILGVQAFIEFGTSATVDLIVSGTAVPGCEGIVATTTPADTFVSEEFFLIDNDLVYPEVTAVDGTPRYLSFTVFIRYWF